MNILALGAHFDDIEIGIGGTLHKHKGDNIFIAITAADESRTGYPEIRVEEQKEAIKLLSTNEKNLLLFSMQTPFADVISALDAIHADILYGMFESDTHQEHRRCAIIGQAVSRKVAQVIMYNSGAAYNFIPNAYSQINWLEKNALLNCFTSQINLKIINIEKIKKMAEYFGALSNCEYAEALQIKNMRYL